MSHSELVVALENVIIDKVATLPTARNRKIDMSAPMDIGLAAKGSELSRKNDVKVAKVAKMGEENMAEGEWQ